MGDTNGAGGAGGRGDDDSSVALIMPVERRRFCAPTLPGTAVAAAVVAWNGDASGAADDTVAGGYATGAG